MSVLGTVDAPLDLFGGLVTDMAAADLPPGVSPECADVAFVAGAVRTRPGLAPVFTPIAGNPTVNYLKTYVQPNLAQTMLALDSAGALWGELAPGTLSAIASAGAIVPGGRAPPRLRCSAASTWRFPTAASAPIFRGSTTARISTASARRAPERVHFRWPTRPPSPR